MHLVAGAAGEMPSPCRKSRSASSFSSGRAARGRGTCRAGAAAPAPRPRRRWPATMNSSISRWLSRRGRGAIAATCAVVVEHDPALGQVEIERAARRRAPRAGRGRRRRERQRPAETSPAILRRLHLLVGEPRRAAHQAAAEAVRRSCGPCASIRSSTNRQPRSSSGRRLHQPLDSASGSIGTTRSGK